ncbi:MAG: hypothetical protein WBA89_14755 [Microcoleus sp.]|uniref:hypothetical protein n=1 Tax=Microcoleus sp. TaxID=44472 RepID=UPI003C75802B
MPQQFSRWLEAGDVMILLLKKPVREQDALHNNYRRCLFNTADSRVCRVDRQLRGDRAKTLVTEVRAGSG